MTQQAPQFSAWLKSTAASQAIRLYFFIFTQPPGVPITMEDMKDAIGVGDSRSISQLLTKIRHGRVPDGGSKGEFFEPIAVSYDRHTRAYYDIGKTTEDNLEQQIPQSILTSLTRHASSRTQSIESAIGDAGLGKAIADGLLSGPDAVELLSTVPTFQLQQLRTNVEEAIAIRNQLEELPQLYAGQADTGAIGDADGTEEE